MIGIALLTIGCATLLAHAGLVAWHLNIILNDNLGPVAGLGAGSLRAIQALAFDASAPTSIAHWILVSCTSLAMIAVGFILWKRTGQHRATRERAFLDRD